MGNFPYPSDYILNDQGLLPPFPVTEACKAMANGSAAFRADPRALLSGLRDAVSVYYNYSLGRAGPQPRCNNIHAGVNNASAEVDFLWNFQYCSEIFQEWLTTYFGGRAIPASNIIFSNGRLDPWSRQGVLPPAAAGAARTAGGVTSAQVGPGSLALLIDLSAHHLDLFFADPRDPPSVVAARKQEMALVAQWIKEKRLAAGRR
eukprot:gene2147-5143_t